MDELPLTQELGNNIMVWMAPKFAITTIKNRKSYLKSIFNKYRVLNTDTLRLIMKNVKHQHQRACISMINTYCYENNIPFNIIVPKIKKREQKLPSVLSPPEIKLMIESAPYPYNLCLRCIFNMGAGLRVSEIIKMQWDHIGWIDWLSNKDNYGIAKIKSGKGSKDRIVNIPKNLMNDLYSYAKEKDILNEFRVPTGGQIFTFEGNTKSYIKAQKELKELFEVNAELGKDKYLKISYDWFRYNIIKRHCEKALNKKIKVHTLRHSRATYLYEIENVPVEKIQVLLGHSSLNTTMLYTKIKPISVFELIKNTNEL
jgi:integrase